MKTRVASYLLLPELLLAAIGMAISTDSAIAAGGDSEAGAGLSVFCAYCHGPDGNPYYPDAPRLAGQKAATLVAKMKAMREANPYHHGNLMMVAFFTAGCLNDQDIENLAAYFARQAARDDARPASTKTSK